MMSSTPWIASSATSAEDGGAENFSGFRVDDNFHEALRFPFSMARPTCHRARADQEPPIAGARLVSVIPARPSGGSVYERVAGYAVAQAPRFTVEADWRRRSRSVVRRCG